MVEAIAAYSIANSRSANAVASERPMSPVKALFADPKHPYTVGLMNSIPKMTETKGELETIEGTVPSIYNLPPGCAFNNRCGQCRGICCKEEPPEIQLEDGRMVKCWKYTENWGEEEPVNG